MRGWVIASVVLAGCGRLGFGESTPAQSWWDTSYGMRAQLTIANTSADPLVSGFPVELAYSLSALGAGVANELRIVYLDPTTHAWSEQNRYTESGHLWFGLLAQLDGGATNTDYWLYFDNPAPDVAPQSGSKLFDFYDAFTATTIDTTKWTVRGTPAQMNNTVILNNGDSIRSNTTFGPGVAVFTEVTTPSDPEVWWGFQRLNDFMDSDPWMMWIQRAMTDAMYPPGVPAGSIWPEVEISGSPIVAGTTGARVLDGGHHLYTTERLIDRVVFKYDEQLAYEYMLPVPDAEQLQVRFMNYGSVALVFSTIHVAKAVWPDPTVTIGAAEPR